MPLHLILTILTEVVYLPTKFSHLLLLKVVEVRREVLQGLVGLQGEFRLLVLARLRLFQTLIAILRLQTQRIPALIKRLALFVISRF